LQWRRDHVQIADIQLRLVQLDLQAEPFAHRRNGHVVDVIGRYRLVQVVQCRPGRVDPGRHTVGGVIGDVVIVPDDAHFRCRARIQ
jgi:hypothetical protein